MFVKVPLTIFRSVQFKIQSQRVIQTEGKLIVIQQLNAITHCTITEEDKRRELVVGKNLKIATGAQQVQSVLNKGHALSEGNG